MISLLAVLLIYIRYRLAWSEYESLGNAPGYYDTVTTYFHGPKTIYNNTLVDEGTESQVEAHYNSTDPCDNFPNTDGILLVMKTGATEVFERVPTHLLTTLRCLPDFLIFSDMVRRLCLPP